MERNGRGGMRRHDGWWQLVVEDWLERERERERIKKIIFVLAFGSVPFY